MTIPYFILIACPDDKRPVSITLEGVANDWKDFKDKIAMDLADYFEDEIGDETAYCTCMDTNDEDYDGEHHCFSWTVFLEDFFENRPYMDMNPVSIKYFSPKKGEWKDYDADKLYKRIDRYIQIKREVREHNQKNDQ